MFTRPQHPVTHEEEGWPDRPFLRHEKELIYRVYKWTLDADKVATQPICRDQRWKFRGRSGQLEKSNLAGLTFEIYCCGRFPSYAARVFLGYFCSIQQAESNYFIQNHEYFPLYAPEQLTKVQKLPVASVISCPTSGSLRFRRPDWPLN